MPRRTRRVGSSRTFSSVPPSFPLTSDREPRSAGMTLMQRRLGVYLFLSTALLLVSTAAARGQTRPPAALTVLNAGPSGEIANLALANEVRVTFSEPMVTLGRIPAVVRAP